jgi:hypothetical protein
VLFFSWVHRRFEPMKAHASDAWREPTIGCTKLLDAMDGKADRRDTRASNCTKRVSTAGRTHTNGGTKTLIVGIPTATGMITTTTGDSL